MRTKESEVRHKAVLLKYSLRAAEESTGDLRDLFLAQAVRLEGGVEKPVKKQKVKNAKTSRNSKKTKRPVRG